MIEPQTVPRFDSLFHQVERMEHEQVVFCYDKETDLKAIIGIHNTVLGPGMGGTRFWPYKDENEAITDVLRLSRGMTFKNSIAGLNIGGGKAVIIGDPGKIKSPQLLRKFGEHIERVGGKYWTAEDVNMTAADMMEISTTTQYATGIPIEQGGSGDPSPVTAYGVFVGMKAAAKKKYGSDSLANLKILVQGVGHVGSHLVDLLAEAGAEVMINDIFKEKLTAVTNKHRKVQVVDSITDIEMDIYAPCALGATLNEQTIPKLKCEIVAGAANNQLRDEQKDGQRLMEKDILYAPDFLINSGGITNVYYEMIGQYEPKKVYAQVENIYDTCSDILNMSEKENVSSHEAALRLALHRIEKAKSGN